MTAAQPGGDAARSGRPARPPFGGRVHYTFGGTLPPAYLDWVRADLLTPGWRHRQARRPVAMMLPFALIFALLPGPLSLRLSVVVFLLLGAVVMGYTTSGYFRNRRLEQHGMPPITRPEEDGEP